MISNFKRFISSNQKDLKYIIILTIFLLIITVPKLFSQYHMGIGNWDTYLYLENGRNFAKMGWGDVPSIAPVLPMILSKMFLLAGHPYQEAIFNIDCLFYILGVIFCYLLFRLKFDETTSLVGSTVYATFTLLYSWVAIGGNDIIGVTGTVITIYLIFISHRFNSKLYYIALPVAAYSFLSRYTAGIMIFSIVFYWIINRVSLKELKDIVIGGILGVVSIGWFLYQFYIHLGTAFPFLGQFSGTVKNTVVLDSGYLPDSFYYIRHLPNYLSSYVPANTTFEAIVNPMGNTVSIISYIYIALLVLAFILMAYQFIRTLKENKTGLDTRSKTMLLACALLFAVFMLTLEAISYIFSFVILFIALYLLWSVIKDYGIMNLDYEMVMLSLLITYVVFQSILFTKNDRYFITALPFIAYYITCAVDFIFRKADGLNIGFNPSRALACIIIIVLLANSLLFVSQIPTENSFSNVEDACMYLEENGNLTNHTGIYSDNWPAVTWYLNVYCQRAVANRSDNYPVKFSHDMLTQNKSHRAAVFYVDTDSPKEIDLPGMDKWKSFNTTQIYRNSYLDNLEYNYVYSDEYKERIKNDFERY